MRYPPTDRRRVAHSRTAAAPVSYESPGVIRSRQERTTPEEPPLGDDVDGDFPAPQASCLPGWRRKRRGGSSTGSRSSRSSIKSREQRALLGSPQPNWETFDGGDLKSPPPQAQTPSTVAESPDFSPYASTPSPRQMPLNTSEETVPQSNTSASRNQRGSPLNLLTPPAPSDRSIRNRALYEAQQRRRGVYDGEMEPVGVRGQEAPTIPASESSSVAGSTSVVPSLRSFSSEGTPAPTRRGMIVTPVAKTRSKRTPLYGDLLEEEEEEDDDDDERNEEEDQFDPNHLVEHQRQPREPDENSHLQFSTETGRAIHFSSSADDGRRGGAAAAAAGSNGGQPPRTPGAASRGRVVEDPSTDSDEDLRYLKQDLIPELPVVPQQQEQQQQTPHAQRYMPQTPHQPTPRPQRSMHQPSSMLSPHHQQQQPESLPSTPARSNRGTPMSAVHATPAASSPERSLDALSQKAMLYVKMQDYDRALHVFLEVLQQRKQKYGVHHASVASDYHNLGTVHSKRSAQCPTGGIEQQQCRQQALECFQAAARTARDALGRNHPNVAVSLVRIGFLLLQSQQYQNAILTFREALRLRLAHFGRQHGLVANLYNNLGVCHMHMGQFPEGRECLDGAVDIQRRTLQTEPTSIHWLELGDTLFNIGGLCLEWIRRQGPDSRRAADAEEVFEECLAIRLRHLGPGDPTVRQVQSLLEMAKSVPRPPGHRANNSLNASRSRSMSPYREASRSASPYRETTPKSSTPSRPTTRPPPVPAESRSVDVSSNRAVNAPSPAPLHRQLTDSTASRPFDESMASRAGRPFEDSIGSRAGLPLEESAVSRSGRPLEESTGGRAGQQVFRSSPREASDKAFPVVGVTVSRDSTEDEKNASQLSGQTNIFMSSQLIPEQSPVKARRADISMHTLMNGSSLEDSFRNDISEEITGGSLPKSFSYDAEENCLISDSGIDSEHGRIHFPITWSKAGIVANQVGSSSTAGAREIMVSRPYRSRPSQPIRRSESASSERWGSETVNHGSGVSGFTTGNAERDAVMARARAILQSHKGKADDETRDLDTSMESVEIPSTGTNGIRAPSVEQNLMEDGVAPLGGTWPSSATRLSTSEMVRDPMNNMQAIHDSATTALKNNDHIEAVRLFSVIVQCQKRRNGPMHADVGAALHNVGIAQLRAQNHDEAVKAFEEAARVRKGALGRDHPLVAVTLVKVGISLLLLHRFEDALWSFREALSVRKHALGALHPSTARIYNNIGCVYVEFNEFREARRAFEAALDVQRNALSYDQDSGPLMFGTASTLCNLAYLYRYRDMHNKAALVLKEASELQEAVLGRAHPTVLSTLDNLADSYASSGQAAEALRYYDIVLERFRSDEQSGTNKLLRAEAVLLYKMSRVHRQRNDLETQLATLKSALRVIRMYADSSPGEGTDTLERRIQYDVRACREEMEKNDLKWI